jgi:hypothetical protein
MPLIVICGGCKGELDLEKLDKGKCPSCKWIVPASMLAAAIKADVKADLERERLEREKKKEPEDDGEEDRFGLIL